MRVDKSLKCLIGITAFAAIKTTSMIILINVVAFFLNLVLASMGLTKVVNQFVSGQDYPPAMALLMIIVLYLVLGLFLETRTLMITTVPIVASVVFSLGHHPVWIGILLMLLNETALITLPGRPEPLFHLGYPRQQQGGQCHLGRAAFRCRSSGDDGQRDGFSAGGLVPAWPLLLNLRGALLP